MIRRLFFWIAKNHWLIRLNFFANRFLFAALILLLAYLGTRVDPNERDRYSNNTPLRGHDSVVTQLAFHPTKKWIASADEAGEIILWDMQGTFREIRKYQIPLDAHDGAIQQMLFTPDGDWLISGGVDHQLIFWATEQLSNETYEDYQSFYPFTDASQTYLNGFAQDEHTAPIEYLEVSPDGNWLASADSAGMIYLWNLTKINYDADTQWFKFLEAPIQLHLGNQLITDITFSQSSRYFAASANFDQGNIHVWDLTKV
ncbi:MAG: hypothetical protein JW750_06095, partial [Anaerolineaceae bacterium]|nr:hypothetical protein [Anaerolineaceae bacterium]